MGKMENASKSRTRQSKIKQAIIASIALPGLISVAMVAPNVLSLLKTTAIGRKLSNKLFYTKSALWELVRDGYIEVDPKTKKNARLTFKGEEKYRQTQNLIKPKQWDGKWRMLIFDIKEEQRSVRDKIRQSLKAFGFVHLQRSVWVYPYDCEEYIVLLKVDQRIGKDVLYVIADQIENDKWLREWFNEPPRGKPFPHSASLHIGGVSRSFALESWETNGFPNPPLMEPRSKLTG